MVSGDHRARAVALEKSKWYRSLSRGLVEFRAVMIAEPWDDFVQSGLGAGGVLSGDNWLSEEPWHWGVFGAATKAELLPWRSRKQETSSPNFNLITLQTLILMQKMLIYSMSAEEYKVWPDSRASTFSQPSNVNFCASVDRGVNVFGEKVCEICRSC